MFAHKIDNFLLIKHDSLTSYVIVMVAVTTFVHELRVFSDYPEDPFTGGNFIDYCLLSTYYTYQLIISIHYSNLYYLNVLYQLISLELSDQLTVEFR